MDGGIILWTGENHWVNEIVRLWCLRYCRVVAVRKAFQLHVDHIGEDLVVTGSRGAKRKRRASKFRIRGCGRRSSAGIERSRAAADHAGICRPCPWTRGPEAGGG